MGQLSKAIIVLMGLPSSGKSTIAEMLSKKLYTDFNYNTIVIGTDSLRQTIPSQREQFDPDIEPFIKDLTIQNIRHSLNNNYSVINDDMNYYKSMRHELKEISEEFHAHFILIHIDVPLGVALKWNKERGSPIPQHVIERVSARFDRPGDYQWDIPLLTIQSNLVTPEIAIQKIVSKIIPIISAPFQPNITPPPSQPSIHEKIDKITRNIVASLATKERNPQILKQVSNFRITYIKNIDTDESNLEEIERDFAQKLQKFVSQLK